MRTIPIAAAAALAILSTTAVAQTSTPRPPAPSATQPQQVHREPAINPLTKEDVSNIEGTSVYGDDGKIGSVSTVLMDPSSKKIDRLVVTAGSILGVGGHHVAIPLDKFSWDADKAAFKLSTTMADLKAMPEWIEGEATATGSSTPPKRSPTTGAGDGDKPAR